MPVERFQQLALLPYTSQPNESLPSLACVAGRMHDCEAKVLLTASGVMRGNKKIDLKAIADSGLSMCEKQGERYKHKLASDGQYAQQPQHEQQRMLRPALRLSVNRRRGSNWQQLGWPFHRLSNSKGGVCWGSGRGIAGVLSASKTRVCVNVACGPHVCRLEGAQRGGV